MTEGRGCSFPLLVAFLGLLFFLAVGRVTFFLEVLTRALIDYLAGFFALDFGFDLPLFFFMPFSPLPNAPCSATP